MVFRTFAGHIFSAFLASILLGLSLNLQAADPVTLQLKWHHQFQFAGYYAAIEKGFFAEEGLDVTLLERDPEQNNILQVLNGQADYGIADSALFLYQSHKVGVRVVAPIFQHSPNVLITLKSSGIQSPQDLVGKRVRFYQNDAEGFSIMAMLAEYRILEQGVIRQPFSTDFNVLLNGETDAIYGYSTNEPFVLRQKGADIHILNPVNYGIDMYGDMLFTTSREIETNYARVEAMRRAVIKGWQYALDNKAEIAQLIIDKYSTNKSFDALMYEANGIEQVVARFTVPIGTIDRGRLQHISKLFARQGLLDMEFSIDKNIYNRSDSNAGEINLSSEEQAYIANNKTIRVGVDRSWYPFDFINNKGQHDGMAADYLALLSQRLGLTFEVERDADWPSVLRLMQKGQLDMLVMAANTPERSVYASFTRPYIRSPMVVVTDQAIDFLDGANDLQGKKVAVVTDYASHEWLKAHHPEINLVQVDSTADGLRKTALGEVFAFVDNLASVSFLIKQEGLVNLKISGQLPYSFDLAMGVRNDETLLRGILQKGLDSITPQQQAEIYEKWVRLEYDTRVDYSKVLPAFIGISIILFLVILYTLRLRTFHGRLQEAEEALIEKNAELEKLSITDKLTGAFNRHKLDASLQDLIVVSHRYGRDLSIILFDLDYFKHVNDQYGHQTGDEVLRVFSGLVKQTVRKSDVFGRWGGEEFLLICPETNLKQALDLANKIRLLISSYQFKEGFYQNVSCGVTNLKPDQTADQLISYCDKLLYEAKNTGRDRAVTDSE
ncbi:MAG: ABC transporter substrate-binding protein [Thiomicrospira sp.]|uniref:transporter substrate-binding domain-containing diguanylate cyclase n=1 Tax=Thiomicrospira sp. TaxID=935 RepID=UPI0019F7D090|nr:transporter substrate-binding domain-containing protein [Thiomicrospira sp.]MBE0493783.1 ABC transporter substrate-binding protein [Thiomicrospira sp.]